MSNFLDTVNARRPKLDYVSPAICEAIFSGSSSSVLVLSPLPEKAKVTGLVITLLEGGDFRLGWNNYPGALCYSVYKLNDGIDPFGTYTIIAECITDPTFDLPDPFSCYIVTAITTEGETPFSDPICPMGDTDISCLTDDNILPEGNPVDPYSFTFDPGPDLTGPFAFSVTAGALPDGLTLDTATGEISGTPTAVETTVYFFQITLLATEGTCSKFFSITVTVETPGGGCITNSSPLPNGVVDVEYSQTLVPDGPAEDPQWTITAGGLPDGLTLDINTGEISGTPTEDGDFSFTVRLTVDGGGFCEKDFDLTVEPNECLSNDFSLTSGEEGVAYTETLVPVDTADPGNKLQFTVTDGALPDGLTLDADTGEISGTPTSDGTFNFTVTVTQVPL